MLKANHTQSVLDQTRVMTYKEYLFHVHRRPLTTTWEETEKESSSGKLLSTTSNTVLENVTVENSEDSSLNK